MELTVLVFLPAFAGLLALLLPAERARHARWVALAGALAALGLSLALFFRFENGGGFQFADRASWIDAGAFEIQYFLAVDGLSMPLVVLTTFLTVAAVLVSFTIDHRQRAYFACLMTLSTSVLGVFTAMDFLLFFLFWELELFPMYLLISIWGSGRREYSAMKFVALHGGGVGLHAGGHPRPRAGRGHLRHGRAGAVGRGGRAAAAALGLPLPVHRVRGEAAHRAPAHVAAGRARRRAHGGLRDARGACS